jgi:hypothetical protein
MTTDAARNAFLKQLDEARRQPQRIDESEIARMAHEAGLPVQDSLREMRRSTPFNKENNTEVYDALVAFVARLCGVGKSTRILEYARIPSLVTAGFAESGASGHLRYIVPDTHVAESLRILFKGRSASVLNASEDLGTDAQFDAIVCQPAIGYRPTGDDNADGFGGEIVRELTPFLAKGGTLYWVTGRGVLFTPRGQKTLADLQRGGLHTIAVIDLAAGVFPGTMIEGTLIALRCEPPTKRFIGALRDLEVAGSMAAALEAGATKKSGPSWTWLDASDHRSFAQIEQSRLLRKLMPRGRHVTMTLRSLLAVDRVEKADKPAPEPDTAASYLFIPEYAGSRVTTDLDEQTVKPKSVYRFAINPAKANPRFLAQLLNGPYGRELRAAAGQGATIQRISAASLLSLELPIPDVPTQDRIARINSDIGLLEAIFRDIQNVPEHDWTALSDVGEKIDRLKGVVDIERQIADWWRELPYPLATIYRRYQVSTEPKDRLDTILHFFEMAAVYLAAIGASHVKAMRRDWKEIMPAWLHPSGGAGVERADFGFWNGLARASLKDLGRIASDKELRAAAIDMAGLELVQVAASLAPLGRATDILDVPRNYRNSWKAHGGLMKTNDAARLDSEPQQSIRDFYEATASIFRRHQLVRPGMAEANDNGFVFQIELLSGSDPTFAKRKSGTWQAGEIQRSRILDGRRAYNVPSTALLPPWRYSGAARNEFLRIQSR